MPASVVQNESILAIDVGAAVTRAVLFDVVEGQYRFVASGQAPTTAEAPFKDIGMGVRRRDRALRDSLQTVLDRKAPEIQAILKKYAVPMFPIAPPPREAEEPKATGAAPTPPADSARATTR